MNRLTVRTSTIFIAAGDKTEIYRSVDEVPLPLRRRLEKSTNSLHSQTILIADRRGREEIVKAIRGLPSSLRPHPPAPPKSEVSPPKVQDRARFLWRNWAEILLPSLIGLIVWLLFSK